VYVFKGNFPFVSFDWLRETTRESLPTVTQILLRFLFDYDKRKAI
jgi:hypothetical protein